DAVHELPFRERLSQQGLALDERARIGVAGHEHDLQLGIVLPQVPSELLSAPVGQEDVGEYEIEMAVVLGAHAKSLTRGRRVDHGVPLRGEDAVSGDTKRVLVVDDQNRALALEAWHVDDLGAPG